MDANQQQEVLKLTPSCVAAVGVLINGQALSTQAQRSALTHFAICPLMVLLLLPSITSLPALAELSSGRFHVPTPMPFPMRVHKLILRRGTIHPTLFRNSPLKFDMEATESYHNTTVCCSTQIRQRTCVNQLVLRDDWNPSQSERSCPLLKQLLWSLHA